MIVHLTANGLSKLKSTYNYNIWYLTILIPIYFFEKGLKVLKYLESWASTWSLMKNLEIQDKSWNMATLIVGKVGDDSKLWQCH